MNAFNTIVIPGDWQTALADYQAKRAIFDQDQDTDAETNRLCGITFAAQDYLLTDVRAPDADAFATKIALMKERELCPDEWLDALLADVRHLLCASSSDPHIGWLAERDVILRRYNTADALDDEAAEKILDEAIAVENRIASTPTTSRDGIFAKAMLSVFEAARNGDQPAAAIVEEAKGLGLVEWEA